MVARLPTPTPSSFGYFHSPALARTIDAAARARALRPDLRALLVGRAVRRARARHPEDPRLRRHGFAEVARIRALQAVSAVARATARRHASCVRRGEAARAPLRPLHGDHARRMGDARRLSAPVRRPTGFRTASTATYFAPDGEPTIPTRSASSGGWTTTRTRSACSISARTTLAADARAPAAARSCSIVGADPIAGDARARRHCPAYGDRLGARRARRTCADRR